MQTQTKFVVRFSKINTKFFSGKPKFPLIPKAGPSPNLKSYSCNCWREMMNYYQHQKF